MKYRNLRITWSVGWGLLCVLLIVPWVRSFQKCEIVFHVGRSKVLSTLGSSGGTVYFARGTILPAAPVGKAILGFRYGADKVHTASNQFEWKTLFGKVFIRFPYWLPVGFSLTLAALPWVRWRVSLRTLLIATTLLAVILGLVIATTR
jgi:hypothetical protein